MTNLDLKIEQALKQKIEEYLDKLSNDILQDARDLCPVDSGNLKDNSEVIKNINKREVVFNELYAFYIHENLELKHKHGEAKFLEKAVLKNTRQ